MSIANGLHNHHDGKPSVCLETAYRWSCPGCLKVNYSDAVVVEMSPRQQERVIEQLIEMGVEDDGKINVIHLEQPTWVTCAHCELESIVDSDTEEFFLDPEDDFLDDDEDD